MSAVDSSKLFEATTPLANAFMVTSRKLAAQLQDYELKRGNEDKRKEEDWKNRLAKLEEKEESIKQEKYRLEQEKSMLSDARTKFVNECKAFETHMTVTKERFRQQKENFEAAQSRVFADNESTVEIDVGGQHKFKTYCKTLCRFPDSTLAQLINARPVNRGTVFIDRDGQHFDFILKYLRSEDDEQAMHTITRYKTDEISDILEEAKYYNLRQLVKALKWALIKRNNIVSDVAQFEREGENGYVTKELQLVDLSGQNFTGKHFERVHFKHITTFEGSVLERAVFYKCKFEATVNFIDTDLREAEFSECELLVPILVTGANRKDAVLPDRIVLDD